jgi:putative membrane protein
MKFQIARAAGMAAFTGMVLLGGLAAQDKAANTGKSMLKGTDSKFVTEAAQGGMAEVKLGQLAAEKASSPDVKQFGQKMVNDHTRANEELKSIASQKGVTLPTDIGAKNQALYDRLSKMSGADFDKAYISHMTSDHKTDVNEFQKESTSGKDPEIKSFASKTLPTLEEHLRMAEDINSKVGGKTSADRMKTPK